jgi:hypothetical protein
MYKELDFIGFCNLVFDYLIERYSEDPDSRLLFLYDMTEGIVWNIIRYNPGIIETIIVTKTGILTSLVDKTIESYNEIWKTQLLKKEQDFARTVINKLDPSNQPQFKDGMIFTPDSNFEKPFKQIHHDL